MTDPRHRRLYVWWGAALGLLAAAGLVCWLVVAPYLQVRSAVRAYSISGDSRGPELVESLGGRARAARRVGRYVHLPTWLADNRIDATCLMAHCGEEAVPELVALLRDPDPDMCLVAAEATANTRSLAGAEALVAFVAGSGEIDVKVEAVVLVLLVDHKNPNLTRLLLDTVESRPVRPNDVLAEVLVARLDSARGPQDAPAVYRALHSRSESVRLAAVGALDRVRDGRTVEALAAALKDESPDVRRQAARILVRVGGPGAVDALIRVLEEGHPDACLGIPAALAELKDRRAVTPLIGALSHASDVIRRQAALALGALGDARASEALRKAAEDKARTVRHAAAWALAKIKAAESAKEPGP